VPNHIVKYAGNAVELSYAAILAKLSMITRKASEIASLFGLDRSWLKQTFLLESRWLALLISPLIAGVPGAMAQGPTSEFDKFSPAHDLLFPKEMEALQDQPQYILDGLRKAGSLRLSLLEPDATGGSALERIADTLVDFQSASRMPLKGHTSIADFDLSVQRLRHQLNGRDDISPASFDAFDGRWFGVWGESEVNHDWQPTQQFTPPKSFADAAMELQAIQYAWISNGFGWNYLVSLPSDADEPAKIDRSNVLGMVYYFTGDDFENISDSKAHVGFADGPTRLVWITEHEVFLEEVFAGDTPAEDTYVITAMYHDLLSESPTVSRRATQAIYTRDPANRPEFHEFRW